ncbi:MAG: hypoxanthine phosphoribosyltransferase [Bacteroidota bacterium]|nr:hypoxanthine phosphoribosyltransferase [Bacteroidota bacterium]
MEQITLKDKKFDLFIPQAEIDNTILRIANEMNKDLKDKNPLFISILNGSFMFTADLLKKINFDCEISFIKLASYSGTASGGRIKKIIGLTQDIQNRTVVILEDIIDTGLTIGNTISQLIEHKPKEIKVSTLLFKKEACKRKFKIDYIGFEIPDDFVVGYGMDIDGLGRNLVNIYKLT